MRKNILRTATATIMLTAASLSVYQAQKTNSDMSDLIMANVEALAQDIEGPSAGYTAESYPCPYPSFKDATVCVRGGSDFACMNSDCW